MQKFIHKYGPLLLVTILMIMALTALGYLSSLVFLGLGVLLSLIPILWRKRSVGVTINAISFSLLNATQVSAADFGDHSTQIISLLLNALVQLIPQLISIYHNPND